MRNLSFLLILFVLFLSVSTAYAQSYCFNRAAFKYGLPVSLIKAVAYTESGLNYNVCNILVKKEKIN